MGESLEFDPGEGSVAGNKRRRLIRNRKLLDGEEVEVRLSEEGLKGSWHKAVVVKCEECVRWVKYNEILTDDNSSQLVESITVTKAVEGLSNTPRKCYRGWLRPYPPHHEIDDSKIAYGMCVDCLVEDAWWEGVVFDKEEGSAQRMVFFPDQGDRHVIAVNMMRHTYDWNEISGDWQPRGTWSFLKLLGELEKKEPFPISVREIWYDISCTDTYHRKIGEWVFGSWATWRHLINAAIKEAYSVALGKSHNSVTVLTESTANSRIMDDLCINELGLATQALESNDTHTSDVHVSVDNVDRDPEEKVQVGHVISKCLQDDIRIKDLKHKKAEKCDYLETPRIRGGGHLGTTMGRMEALTGSSENNQGILDLVSERHNRSTPKYYKGSKSARRNAENHLLSIGWKMKKFGCGINYFVSPNGKRYNTLVAACEACNESEIHTTDKTCDDSGNLITGNPCPELLNKAETSGDKLATVSGDADLWQPVDIDAEYCHEYIVSYAQYMEYGKPELKKTEGDATDFDLKTARLNVKKHLLALGWRIFKLETKNVRYWYISPDGLKFCALSKVVPHLINTGEYQIIDGVSAGRSQDCSKFVCSSDVPNGGVFDTEDHVLENHRKAILDYINCMERKNINVSGIFSEEAKTKRLIAKKHLRYLGWTFFYVNKRGHREMRYRSPDRRCCSSLLKACKISLEQMEGKTTEVIADGTAGVKKSSLSFDRKPSLRIKFRTSAKVSAILKKFQNHRVNRINGVTHDPVVSSFSFGGIRGDPDKKSPAVSPNHKKTKKRKISGTSNIDDTSDEVSVSRLSKQARVATFPLSQHAPRSILSWLIENGAVQPRQKVRYLRKRDGHILMEGRITHGGIKCNCCNKIVSLSTFESHAGSSNHRPAANIFLLDGRSLLECQRQIMQSEKPKDFPHKRIKSDYSLYPSDAICSMCQDGGTLVLCDHCPSSFHLNCVGLEVVPEGKWFCPSCRCSICGLSEFNSDTQEFTPETKLFCDQCEREYHVGCLKDSGISSLTKCPEGYWFCRKICSEIFWQLRSLVGKSYPTALADFTWTILRAKKENDLDFGTSDKEGRTDENSKLCDALEVLHECFLTIIEPRTRTDLIEDLLYNKESELNRLNFWGFYTILLEKGDVVVSVATFRVYGNKVAEMPLVGTRVQYRRKGMCRLLMNELEKLLGSLGVERLLLPAVPELLETWTKSFGFTVMTHSDRLMLSSYTFLGFQSTKICQKFLKSSFEISEELIENANQVEENMDCSDDTVLEEHEIAPPTLPCVLAVDSHALPSVDITASFSVDSDGSFPIKSCSENIRILHEDEYACLQKELKDQTLMNTAPVEIDENYGFAGTSTQIPMVKSLHDVDHMIAGVVYRWPGQNVNGFLLKPSNTFRYFYKRRVLAN